LRACVSLRAYPFSLGGAARLTFDTLAFARRRLRALI
jgi:hypothetical protein